MTFLHGIWHKYHIENEPKLLIVFLFSLYTICPFAEFKNILSSVCTYFGGNFEWNKFTYYFPCFFPSLFLLSMLCINHSVTLNIVSNIIRFAIGKHFVTYLCLFSVYCLTYEAVVQMIDEECIQLPWMKNQLTTSERIDSFAHTLYMFPIRAKRESLDRFFFFIYIDMHIGVQEKWYCETYCKTTLIFIDLLCMENSVFRYGYLWRQ